MDKFLVWANALDATHLNLDWQSTYVDPSRQRCPSSLCRREERLIADQRLPSRKLLKISCFSLCNYSNNYTIRLLTVSFHRWYAYVNGLTSTARDVVLYGCQGLASFYWWYLMIRSENEKKHSFTNINAKRSEDWQFPLMQSAMKKCHAGWMFLISTYVIWVILFFCLPVYLLTKLVLVLGLSTIDCCLAIIEWRTTLHMLGDCSFHRNLVRQMAAYCRHFRVNFPSKFSGPGSFWSTSHVHVLLTRQPPPK